MGDDWTLVGLTESKKKLSIKLYSIINRNKEALTEYLTQNKKIINAEGHKYLLCNTICIVHTGNNYPIIKKILIGIWSYNIKYVC